jgi:hypothetical protein
MPRRGSTGDSSDNDFGGGGFDNTTDAGSGVTGGDGGDTTFGGGGGTDSGSGTVGGGSDDGGGVGGGGDDDGGSDFGGGFDGGDTDRDFNFGGGGSDTDAGRGVTGDDDRDTTFGGGQSPQNRPRTPSGSTGASDPQSESSPDRGTSRTETPSGATVVDDGDDGFDPVLGDTSDRGIGITRNTGGGEIVLPAPDTDTDGVQPSDVTSFGQRQLDAQRQPDLGERRASVTRFGQRQLDAQNTELFGDFEQESPLTGNRLETDLQNLAGGQQQFFGQAAEFASRRDVPATGPFEPIERAQQVDTAADRLATLIGEDLPRRDGEGPTERQAEGAVTGLFGGAFNPAAKAAGGKELIEAGGFVGRNIDTEAGRQRIRASGEGAAARAATQFGEAASERPRQFGGALAGNIAGEAALGTALSPLKVSRFDVPTGPDSSTTVRGVRTRLPGVRDRTLVGTRGARPTVGTPDVDPDAVDLTRLGSRGDRVFEPVGQFETDIFQATARAQGGEAAARAEAVGELIGEADKAGRTDTDFQVESAEELVGEARRVPEGAEPEVADALRDLDATVFGSAAARSQLPDARQPNDLDIAVVDETAAKQRLGEALEGQNADVGDVFDIKEIEDAPSKAAAGAPLKFGRTSQAPRELDGLRVNPASEELIRKAGASGFFREPGAAGTPEFDVGPQPRRPGRVDVRAKDVTDAADFGESILGPRNRAVGEFREAFDEAPERIPDQPTVRERLRLDEFVDAERGQAALGTRRAVDDPDARFETAMDDLVGGDDVRRVVDESPGRAGSPTTTTPVGGGAALFGSPSGGPSGTPESPSPLLGPVPDDSPGLFGSPDDSPGLVGSPVGGPMPSPDDSPGFGGSPGGGPMPSPSESPFFGGSPAGSPGGGDSPSGGLSPGGSPGEGGSPDGGPVPDTPTIGLPGGGDDNDRRRDDDDDDDRSGGIFGVMFGERTFSSGIADAEEAAASFFGEGREFSDRPLTNFGAERTGSETFEFGDELY